jgi:hypothetical protein
MTLIDKLVIFCDIILTRFAHCIDFDRVLLVRMSVAVTLSLKKKNLSLYFVCQYYALPSFKPSIPTNPPSVCTVCFYLFVFVLSDYIYKYLFIFFFCNFFVLFFVLFCFVYFYSICFILSDPGSAVVSCTLD